MSDRSPEHEAALAKDIFINVGEQLERETSRLKYRIEDLKGRKELDFEYLGDPIIRAYINEYAGELDKYEQAVFSYLIELRAVIKETNDYDRNKYYKIQRKIADEAERRQASREESLTSKGGNNVDNLLHE